jgi:hypothetical protein
MEGTPNVPFEVISHVDVQNYKSHCRSCFLRPTTTRTNTRRLNSTSSTQCVTHHKRHTPYHTHERLHPGPRTLKLHTTQDAFIISTQVRPLHHLWSRRRRQHPYVMVTSLYLTHATNSATQTTAAQSAAPGNPSRTALPLHHRSPSPSRQTTTTPPGTPNPRTRANQNYPPQHSTTAKGH